MTTVSADTLTPEDEQALSQVLATPEGLRQMQEFIQHKRQQQLRQQLLSEQLLSQQLFSQHQQQQQQQQQQQLQS